MCEVSSSDLTASSQSRALNFWNSSETIRPKARALIDPVIPTNQDVFLARDVLRALYDSMNAEQPLSIQFAAAATGYEALALPPIAAKLLMQMLTEMSEGHAITLVTTKIEISTDMAADLLSVSEPLVAGLIDKGLLSAHTAGSQLHVLLHDVLAYKTMS